jgi:hypothetical protein
MRLKVKFVTKLKSNTWITGLHFPAWALAAAALFILIVILWLPFGLNVMGIQEEWSNRAFVEDSNGPWLTYERYSRPGKLIPITLAHVLTPDSFVGYNLVQATLFFGKGMMFYFLVRRFVPDTPIVAFTAALLFIIYPADEGLMTMRSTPIHFAIFCFLTALNLLLAYWDRPCWLTLIGIWLTLGLSLGTYEIAYPLALVSPVFLLWREKRLSRRVIQVSTLWYVGFLIPFANTLIRFGQQNSMQRNLLEAGTAGRDLSTIFREMLDSLVLAYRRHFIIGWETAVGQLDMNGRYLLLAILMALLVLVVTWIMRRERVENDQKSISSLRQYVMFALGGVIWIALALLLYLPTTRRYEDWRVYYMSSVGAAFTVTLIVLMVSCMISRRFLYPLFTILMAILICLAMVRILHQHQRYVDVSLKEAYILSRVVEEAPALKKPAYFLLVPPESGEPLSSERLYLAQAFDAALSLTYQDYNKVLGVDFCYPPDAVCRFQNGGIEVSGLGKRTIIYPYNQVLLFEASEHDGIKLLDGIPQYLLSSVSAVDYDPDELIDRGSQPPRRVHTLFSRWPVPFNYPLLARDDFADFLLRDYSKGSPVILQTPSETCISQSDCTLQAWLSGDIVTIPASERFYITPDLPAATGNLDRLRAFVDDSESVWYVRGHSLNPSADDFLNMLRPDYVVFRTSPWNGQYYPEVTLYRKKPELLQDLFLFGGSMSLQAWTLRGDVNVQPCQTIQLSTWWLAKDRIDANYSMTLVLADESGIGMTRSDGAPSNFLPQLWQVGDSYLDERTLTIPCDIQPGQYPLLVGLYNYETVETLPVTQPDGTPTSPLVYLTTLNLE